MKLQRKSSTLRQAILASIVPAIGLTASGINHAQPALEEIIVTSQKRVENLQDVAISVVALAGDELRDAGIDTQKMLAMVTPNVAVNANANFIAPYIRGVGTQYANPGLEPSVASYFNDVYMSRASAGFMNFHDIERVEVLKGPQGTLYGRNTTGGAIRIITKDPTDYFEAGIGMTMGNYEKLGADFYLSGPLSDNVRGRLSGQWDSHDGWVKNVAGGPDLQDRNLGFLHGKLQWDATDRLTVNIAADYTRKRDREGMAFAPLFSGLPEQVGPAFGGEMGTGHHEFSGNFDHESVFDAGGAQIRADYQFDGFIFSSITGYRYTKFRGFADLDATSVPLLNATTELERTEDYSQEFQIVSDSDSKWNWVAGVFYFVERADANFGMSGLFIEADMGFPSAFIGGVGEIEVESLAPYGQIAYEFTDQWEIMIGLRYTDETKKVQNDFYVSTLNDRGRPVHPYLSLVPGEKAKVSFEELSPKIQLTWRPNDNVMLYAMYQEGFKSGGFNMPHPSPAPVTQVESETLKSYEIGWKAEFNRLRFNGAIFHYKLDDLQLQITDLGAGGITSVRNAGSATVDGVEFDLTYAATERLQLGAGLGWQDTEFGSVPNGQYFVPCAQVPHYLTKGYVPVTATCQDLGGLGLEELVGNLKGNSLPQAPDLTGYVRASYTQPLEHMGSMLYNIVASYSDEFSWTSDNLYKEPSKVLVNANITWNSSDEQFSVSFFGTNLTDEDHHTHKSAFSASGGWQVPAPPRMYGVRVGVNF